MGRIGFCRTEEAEKAYEPVENPFLAFDSGRAISAEDAFRHVGIFGATGTGKTVSGIIPCMDAAIREGGTVLVIDPKGSLGPYVRGLADSCGRYRDVLEFGTMPSAMPLNVIEDMSESELFAFAKEIYARFTDGGKSWNMDFHVQGCIGARDVYTLLRGIEKLAGEDGSFSPADFAPTLPMILGFLTEPRGGTAIFNNYMKVAEITDDLWKFAKRIRGSVFHILNQGKKVDETDDDHLRHVAYNHDGIINALGAFLEEPGVIDKFCCAGAPGLDFSVCEGRIVLFRFGAGAGGAAACLCRMAIEAFYKWVYKEGIGGSEKTVIIDEFQEVAKLTADRLSDTSFLALAREFRCREIIATQSYSALAALDGLAGLEALTANLNSKIFFHTEDPLTRAAVSAMGGPDLVDLQNSCFAATYDTRKRVYAYGEETLDRAYGITKGVSCVACMPVEAGGGKPSMPEIESLLDHLARKKQRACQEAAEAARRKEAEEMGDAAEQREGRKGLRLGEVAAMLAKERKEKQHMTDYDRAVDDGDCIGSVPFWDDEPEKAEKEAGARRKADPDDLMLRHGDLFEDGADVQVPAGFRAAVSGILALFSRTGLDLRIGELRFVRGDFRADGKPAGNVTFLNRMLARLDCVCAVCGKPIMPNALNLCDECSAALPMEKPEFEEEEEACRARR